MPHHHFTVDVEEYFQVSAFESMISRDSWNGLESRVAGNVARLLELLEGYGARATFFVLGWIAEHHPKTVRAIAAAGHEIASHGYAHRCVKGLTQEEFRESVRRTKALLEDITGEVVIGFRAPTFSIIPGCEWALDILIEEGYRYDSSLFPIRRPGYGYPAGPRDPYLITRSAGILAELPPTTLRVSGVNVPAAGGAYFRLLPYRVIRAAVRDCERRNIPATLYLHPWEIDPGQPRLDVSWLTRLRHYGGLNSAVDRLRRLLTEFGFAPIRDWLVKHSSLVPG